jgi:hypothetical protein
MDERSAMEKRVWDLIGPPLYYCEDCLRQVKVTPVEGSEPIIKRYCEHTGRIIAPRKAIMAGKGGLSAVNKIRSKFQQIAASITGRCV